MDSSTGMSYLQNQIQHKKWVMKVKTVFLGFVSIHRNLFLKFQKYEKVDGTRHLAQSVMSHHACFCHFKHYLRRIETSVFTNLP